VLSRWHVEGCANCQTHLLAGASFPLHGLDAERLGEDALEGEVRTHEGLLGGRPHRWVLVLSSVIVVSACSADRTL
jgi:tyrosinase